MRSFSSVGFSVCRVWCDVYASPSLTQQAAEVATHMGVQEWGILRGLQHGLYWLFESGTTCSVCGDIKSSKREQG